VRIRSLPLPSLLGVVMVVVAGRAPAAGPVGAKPQFRSVTLAAGGGLQAISARVDVASRKLFLRTCPGLPCEAGTDGVPIELEGALDLNSVRMDPVSLGGGKQVLRVVVPSSIKTGVAWEALVAGRESSVLFVGATGFGGTGEGSGHRVLVEGTTIYVGKLRRELTVCGQSETILEPRRLDPKTLELRRVAMHRIAASVRSAAPTLVASAAPAPPIGSLLSVRGGSVHDGASTALADDDENTAWTETLKGDGKGEFVVFSAPKAMAFDRLSILLSPTKKPEGYAPPTSLWLSVDDATYRIAIPQTSDARVEVVLPKPINTQCLALSIDNAEGKDPVVGLAEVDAVPILPSTVHSLEDLVTLLDTTGADADLAQTVLGNAGARGVTAIGKKLAALGNAGRMRALDVLDGAPCEAAAYPLATMSYDAPKVLAARAREVLDQCGAAATKAIAETYSSGGDAAREVLAERWVKLDPKNAVPAILQTVRKADAKRRYTFRNALARAARMTVGRESIAAWLASPVAPAAGEVDPAIELARAVAALPELAEQPNLRAQLAKVLLERASETRPFESQWLAAEPLAALGGFGDLAALARLRLMHKSKDRYLRARAAEVSGDVEPLRPEVVAALHDADARVRRSALIAIRRGSGPTGAVAPIMQLLRDDGWTYVRVAAAETLGEAKGGGDVDVALGDATKDDLPAVRGAAIRALVTRGARSQLPAIRKRAFDPNELVEVRAEAIGALGALCDKSSVDELFDIAKRGSSNEGAHQMALAAVAALGDIHPVDLAQRLSALDQTSLVMKDAIRRALKSASTCK